MLVRPKGWKPQDFVSPSFVRLFRGCPRAGVFRYAYGLRAEKGDDKSQRVFMLGKLVHKWMELYLQGMPIDLRRACEKDLAYFSSSTSLALVAQAERAALPLTRLIEPQDEVRCEVESAVHGWQYYIDLVYRRKHDGLWCGADYKTTGGRDNAPWFYVPSVAELRKDPASVVYATHIQRAISQEDRVPFAYLYTVTKGMEQATVRKWDFTKKEIDSAWDLLQDEAAKYKELAANPPRIHELPLPPVPTCAKFGGCIYHHVCLRSTTMDLEDLLSVEIASAEAFRPVEADKPVTVDIEALLGSAPPAANDNAVPLPVEEPKQEDTAEPAAVEVAEQPVPEVEVVDAPAKKRRGRPPKAKTVDMVVVEPETIVCGGYKTAMSLEDALRQLVREELRAVLAECQASP